MFDYFLTTLPPARKQQLDRLAECCRKNEPISLHIPEDAANYLFTCNDEDLPISCIAVCEVQEDLWECYAFTHPDYRRKGLFFRLLKAVCQMAEERESALASFVDLVFLTDEKSPSALAAIKALSMNFWYSEYQMSWEKSASFFNLPNQDVVLNKKIIREDEEEIWIYLAFSAFKSSETGSICQTGSSFLGSCRILPYDDSRFYLYHLEIKKEQRGKGWGGKLLNAVLGELPQNSSVTLQVSSDNVPAVNLYKKTGFQIREILSYFLC